jgi:hypothetical protein
MNIAKKIAEKKKEEKTFELCDNYFVFIPGSITVSKTARKILPKWAMNEAVLVSYRRKGLLSEVGKSKVDTEEIIIFPADGSRNGSVRHTFCGKNTAKIARILKERAIKLRDKPMEYAF